MRGLCMIFGAVIILVLAVLLFGWYSPWPAAWLLRRGEDGPVSVPEGFSEKTADVEVRKDLSYPSAFGKNTYDLYLPAGEEAAPLIVWVHGGAFVAGDKSGTKAWGKLLASEGYAVASMNYEWAPEAAWPSQVLQVTECLAELARLAGEGLPLDTERIFLAGDSAGAHIAMQAAQAWFNERFSEETGISVSLEKEALRGLLLYCGPYEPTGFAKLKDRGLRFFMNKVGQSYVGAYNWLEHENTAYLNVPSWLTKDCPPVYVTDGNSGSFAVQGIRLAEALRALKVPVWERFFTKEDKEIPHEYQMDLTTEEGKACYEDSVAFLNTYSKGKGKEDGK